jgi:N-acetylglucosaminyl-diphospho-decaprenol L-rhamnosyltransferase
MSPSSDRRPRVGVLTVSYGSEDVLGTFLDSIGTASSAPVAIVVADNRPSPDIEATAVVHGASYLALPDNPGYGGAVNAAARTLPADIDWLLIVNPDVILGEGSIDQLVASGDADPRIASIGPAVRDPDGTLYPSARRIPSLRIGIGHALFAGVWPANPWSRAYREESAPFRREAGWLSGSCLLVRRTAFDSVGGFDPGYFMYFEDVDLGNRLSRAGWLNVYEPEASVVHSGAHSTQSDSAAMIRAHHVSASRFIRSKYPGVLLSPIRITVGMGLRLRSWIQQRNLH